MLDKEVVRICVTRFDALIPQAMLAALYRTDLAKGLGPLNAHSVPLLFIALSQIN